MAIVHVGDGTDTAGVAGVVAITYSPTAGNALVVFVTQSAAATRTYAVTDNIDGATGWNTGKYFNAPTNNRVVGVYYKANVPAGIVTVTVTANTGTTAVTANVSEFSGMGTAITVDASDSLEEAGTTNSHTASSGGVSSANEVVAAVAGVLTNAQTECSAGASYTEVTVGLADGQKLKEYAILSAPSANTGPWSHTGTARVGMSVIALLSGNAVAGRTTKNTRSAPLGMEIGMDWRGDL